MKVRRRLQQRRLRKLLKMNKEFEIIDFHSHILPCADHGSDGIETTKKQIALMNNAGVDTVVLTPHFYPNFHTVDTFHETVDASLRVLTSSIEDRPRVCVGAEVLYYDGIERMEGLETLCIKGTNILMLELPMMEWSKKMINEIKRLAGEYTLLLAHVDRYVVDHKLEIATLLSAGAYAQINSSSMFHCSIRRELMSFIDGGQIYAIGSDIHGTGKKSYARFVKAERRLGERYAIIMESASKLLENAERF